MRRVRSAKERAEAKAKAREVGLARNFKRKKPTQAEIEDCKEQEQSTEVETEEKAEGNEENGGT